MKNLKTVLKWIGILVGALVITALLTVLIDWPLWVAFFAFLVILGLILLVIHLVRKKIYEYKTGFIKKEAIIDITEQGSLARYKKLVEKLEASHHKNLAKNIKTMPWILNLQVNDQEFFNSVQKFSVASTDSLDELGNVDVGAKWAITEHLAVLTPEIAVYENFANNDVWVNFLEEACKWRPDAPFNKIVISISIKELLGEVASVTSDKLAVIKQKIQNIYDITGCNIPVAMVFTDIQDVEHSKEFLDLLTSSDEQQSLGEYAQDVKTNTSEYLYAGFITQLNNYIDRYTLEHAPETLSILYNFINNIEALAANVSQVCNSALPVLKGKTTFLTGLFFIGQEETEANNKQFLFVRDLLQVVLPKQNFLPYQSTLGKNRLEFRQRYKLAIAYCIYGFLLLYILYAFLGTNQSLRAQLKSIPPHITYGTVFDGNLIAISHYHDLMENIIDYQNRWTIRILPFHAGLKRIESTYTAKFHAQFEKYISPPLYAHIRRLLEEDHGHLRPLQHAYLIEMLVETLNIVQAKLDGQSFDYINHLDSPEIQYLGFYDVSPDILSNYGKLLKFYVWTTSSKAELLKQKGYILKLIKSYSLLDNDADIKWIVQWANTQADTKPVVLRDFWFGSEMNPPVKVESAYTTEGAHRIHKLIRELNMAFPTLVKLRHEEKQFDSWYLQQRLLAWYNFALHFGEGLKTLKYKGEWTRFFDSPAMLSTAGPYYGLLDRIYNEFSDVALDAPPSWLAQIRNFYSLLDFAVKKSELAKGQHISAVTRSFLEHVTTRPSVLHQRNSLKHLYAQSYDSDLHAAEAFLNYQIDLNTVYSKAASSIGSAYKIAKAIYYTEDEKDSPEAKTIYSAYGQYRKMRDLLSTPDNQDTVFWMLLRGPLDYYIDYTSRQASCFIQQQWESQVLKATSGLKGKELTSTLFGKKGLMWTFSSKYLQPFIQINDGLFVPNIVLGHIFPFNTEFYDFINHGLTIETVKREQQQFEQYFNEHGGRNITVTSMPITTNKGAKILPYKVSVTTTCNNKAFFINNYNFKIATTFNWKLGQCGPATVNIYFKTFTVTKNYPGQFGFAHFLTDFSLGPVTWAASEFPTEENMLAANNIKSLVLNYNVQGLEDVNLKLSKFFRLNDILLKNEHTYLDDGRVPQQITMCWNHSLQTKIYKEENTQIANIIAGGK